MRLGLLYESNAPLKPKCKRRAAMILAVRSTLMVRAGMPKCFAVLELLFSHAKGHSIKWKRLNEPKEERRGLFAGDA